MDLHLIDFGRRIRLRSAGGHAQLCADGAWHPWPGLVAADEWAAGAFIRRHFRNSFEIGRLRAALAPAVYEVTRWSDEEVLREAARRLAGGAWRIACHAPPAGGAGVAPEQRTGGGAGQEAPAAAPARASTPQHARTPAPAAAPIAAAPAAPPVAPVATQGWITKVDQVRQAVTFETGAQRRSPFIEFCPLPSRAAKDKGNHE